MKTATATLETAIPEALLRAMAEAERRQQAAINRLITKLAGPEPRKTAPEDKP